MKIYEEKEVMKKEKILKTVICDECKKDINQLETDHYYSVSTHHSRWGNDSGDSWEYLELCSYDCLLKNIKKYFSNAGDTDSYDIEREDK
jgi:hypothetical protein